MLSSIFLQIVLIAAIISISHGFMVSTSRAFAVSNVRQQSISRSTISMNFFEDAVRFFSNMKKEASAKHILIKGPDAASKLAIIKGELEGVEDLSAAFSELAAKVSYTS